MSLRDRIKDLQRALGVTADGIAGPVTIGAALERVAEVGGLAGRMEYPKGTPSAATFVFDERTESALATLKVEAQEVFRPFIAAAQAVAASMGCDYVAISGTRSCAEQNALFAQGRTKAGKKVTNAKCGESNHNFGIALDFGVFDGGRYLDNDEPTRARRVHAAVGEIAARHGVEWGGNWVTFVDAPHFQVTSLKGGTV